MPSRREMLEQESLQQLADRMQDGPTNPAQYYPALAELEHRKACWQQEATEAAKNAAAATREAADAANESARAAKDTADYTKKNAEAAKKAADAAKESARAANDTAEYTKDNARYMLWSVIAIFVTSFISALVNILAWLFPRGHT
jgi:methyl-accepting chemotaxis protein